VLPAQLSTPIAADLAIRPIPNNHRDLALALRQTSWNTTGATLRGKDDFGPTRSVRPGGGVRMRSRRIGATGKVAQKIFRVIEDF
jgi:hypothetical protein